jgi:hypothetical protein
MGPRTGLDDPGFASTGVQTSDLLADSELPHRHNCPSPLLLLRLFNFVFVFVRLD